MTDAAARQSRTASLIPIFLDDNHLDRNATPYLWPADGNAKRAAELLYKAQPGTKDTNAQLAATTARQLELYSDTFRDTIIRTPGSSLVSIQYAVKVQDEPLTIIIDQLKWDLNTPNAMISVYASRVARDLGLGIRAAIYIEDELRKVLHATRKMVLSGSKELIKRPDVGQQVRKTPAKLPKLIVGDQAKAMMERHSGRVGTASPRAGDNNNNVQKIEAKTPV